MDGLTNLKYELISVSYEEKYGGFIHIIFEPRTPLLGDQVIIELNITLKDKLLKVIINPS